MKVVVKEQAKGSLKWIRTAVNDAPSMLNNAISEAIEIPSSDEIEWV